MNFYQFCLNYLINQTLSKFPDFPTDELKLYYLTPYIYQRYKTTNITKNNLMELMFGLLSTNNHNHINHRYLDYELLTAYLNDFDPDYIAILDENSLFEIFKTFNDYTLPETYGTFNEPLWENLAKNVVSAAKYLTKYFEDFDSYINHIHSNPEIAMKEILEIRGFGEFTATNYFTILGCYEFWKPHPLYNQKYIDLFSKIDPAVINDKTFLQSLEKQAKIGGVSSYTLYNIIRLIMTPNYYKHNCSMKNSKKTNYKLIFQDALTTAIANKTLIM